ncbi:RDD family protein [Flavobacterium psychrophilum]|uniref:RDD family protein n=1 Tax=Flavobacterium psychrophilum TaxID=96345 RepID=UPI00073F5532|nr:RDD family protein [Flavobacterium psychrophilum]EKT2069019.1 RDD family protein [Flavobacterium psychrophilum]EKT4500140.1 RDD family protein [Flavobacterium psychrophilum]EKT4508964.1 RDD family protein [Flavobacterium psychrophilum]EKT4552863.1 RDD family protein [Flavobacterium psychrophilum]MCB6099114.1 RDD family protein [Flavobacterium psychrophilum]
MEIKKNYEFANFGIRLGALLIDFVLLIVIMSYIIPKVIRLLKNNITDLSFEYFLGLIFAYLIGVPILGLIYRSVFESSKFQGTPGKIITGIKVVDHNFERLKFKQALARNFMKIFSALVFYIGYLIALGNQKCLTWHDKFAKTYVIREIKGIIIK